MSDRLLDIEGIEIAYRRRGEWLPVVRNVDLHLAPGEAYGLVGESGCGKSTLALAVMRYLPPNARIGAGRITFLGRDLYAMGATDLRELRGRRIAMVYQNPGSALNPSLTVGTQVAEVFGRHLGLDRKAAASAAVDMLARMRISDPERVARQHPFQLSGGMQQRAVLAMALATDPDLLVLDEPTTALDATVQAEILALFANLRRTSRTAMLFISHNLAIVRQVCDRVGVMYAGEIAEEGPAARVLDRPRHPYTAALLACLPRPGQRKGARRLATISGSPPDLGGLPPGCPFEPRCPSSRPSCRGEAPDLADDGPDTRVRCFFPVEDRTRRAVPGPAAAERPRTQQAALAVRDLRHVVGTTEILKGVSLEIPAGETFGLVGESGSGKTTLAKAVAGLAQPSSGSVTLDGAVLAPKVSRRTRAQRRAVQLVFQTPDTTLNPSWRVGTMLRRAARKLGGISRAEAAERVRTLFGLVHLPDGLSGSLPGRLSGGQRQRVAIARAFAGDPGLVILDEPTSALDVSVQAAILNLLLDLQRESGAAYLFISHDLAVVRYLADTVGVMFRGELVEVGPTERVFAPPHHPYTAALLDALPDLGRPDPGRSPTGPAAGGGRNEAAPAIGGCALRNRCALASDRCAQETPPWRNADAGHAIRCWVEPGELARPSHAAPTGDRRRADGAQ